MFCLWKFSFRFSARVFFSYFTLYLYPTLSPSLCAIIALNLRSELASVRTYMTMSKREINRFVVEFFWCVRVDLRYFHAQTNNKQKIYFTNLIDTFFFVFSLSCRNSVRLGDGATVDCWLLTDLVDYFIFGSFAVEFKNLIFFAALISIQHWRMCELWQQEKVLNE